MNARSMTAAMSLACLAGVAGVASAQVTNEVAFNFDGVNNWASVRGLGTAKLYRKDDAVFANPASVLVPASGASGRPAHAPDGSTDALDAFGTCTSFGLPLLGGQNRVVYQTAGNFTGGLADRSLGMAYWTNDNLTGAFTENFTFGWDLLIPSSIVGPAAIPLFNDTERDGNDCDAWIFVNADQSLSFHYYAGGSPTSLNVSTGQWFRLVLTMAPTAANVYVNGTQVGTTGISSLWDNLRADLSNRADVQPFWASWSNLPNIWFDPTIRAGCTFFGDNDGVNGSNPAFPFSGAPVYVANIYTGLGQPSASDIANWGGPSAAGFPVQNAVSPTVEFSTDPRTVIRGNVVTVVGRVTPGVPAGSSYTVTADLSSVGGSATQQLFDDGLNGDGAAGDLVFGYRLTTSATQTPDIYPFTGQVVDNNNRSSTASGLIDIALGTPGTNENQWDFNWDGQDPATKLQPTFGTAVLTFWDRPGSGVPGTTESVTSFGTCSSFGIPTIAGVDAQVMKTAQYFGDEGLQLDNNMPGNGGGVYVNQYTIIYDLYIDPASIALTPPTADGWWFPFFNTNNTNSNDADAYIQLTDGALAPVGALGTGAIGGYSPNGAFLPGQWNRVAWVIDAGLNTPTDNAVIYVNGTPVFTSTFAGFEGRMALYSTSDEVAGESRMHLFTEPSGDYTTEAYVNSIYLVDRALSPAEIASLGGADADGPFGGNPCAPADFNSDGQVDFFDYLDFASAFGNEEPAADFNADGQVDFFDYLDFASAFGNCS
ncbi:MAG: LamG-like jellyroll fold domain-containing protein [Planctomycetota bacterium]|nr:LamG-like jellyroll fold domain-containing protein [Planctomycetota bacterium]